MQPGMGGPALLARGGGGPWQSWLAMMASRNAIMPWKDGDL